MENQVARNFNEQVDELLSSTEKKTNVYSSLNKFQTNYNVHELVTELKNILADPDYMPIFDHLRPLVPVKQQLEYDWLQPSRTGERMRTVTLQRPTTADDTLGFALRGGLEFGLGLHVTGVTPGSQADQQGLRVGDQIVRINGYTLHQALSYEVADLIKAKQLLELNVKNIGLIPEQRCEEEPIIWSYVQDTLSDRAILLDGEYYTAVNVSVILPIGPNFGCSIVSNLDGDICVKSVTQGSIAEHAGLEPTDQILQVNGTVFSNISHSEAVVAMKGSRLLNITLLKKLNSKLLQTFISQKLPKQKPPKQTPPKQKSPKQTPPKQTPPRQTPPKTPKIHKGKARNESDIKRSRENKLQDEQSALNDLNKLPPGQLQKNGKESVIDSRQFFLQDDVILLNATHHDLSGSPEPPRLDDTSDTNDFKCGNTNDRSKHDKTYNSSGNIKDHKASLSPSNRGTRKHTRTNSIDLKENVTENVQHFTGSLVAANTDLAEVEHIYEEPIKLIETFTKDSTNLKPMPQDNLRELRKKVAERKLSGAKPLLSGVVRSESIQELDESEPSTQPNKQPTKQPITQISTSHNTNQIQKSIKQVENCNGRTQSVVQNGINKFTERSNSTSSQTEKKIPSNAEPERKISTNAQPERTFSTTIQPERKFSTNIQPERKFSTNIQKEKKISTNTQLERNVSTSSQTEDGLERKVCSTSQLSLSVDTSGDGGGKQQHSPKGVVYPHTTDKNPSFRIQKPVLLHPTRKPDPPRSPSTVSQSDHEPARLFRLKQ